MKFNRRHLIILLIVIVAGVLICAASAKDVSAAKTSKTTVKIHNFKPGVLWAPKAKILKNGDAIAGYVEYKGNMQFSKGTGVTAWYVGSGYDGDIEPHHIKLVKAKFFFKNKKGKVKTKTVKGKGAHISTKLIKGYTPYKATVWYKSK
jgi:major membrane immunogen (membrane-anchored lipoprotein)